MCECGRDHPQGNFGLALCSQRGSPGEGRTWEHNISLRTDVCMCVCTCLLTTYSPILRVSNAVFPAFLRPREVDRAVLLLCMDDRAVYIPRFIAWVALATTDGCFPDGSTERLGGGALTFSGSTSIFTSRAVLAKICLPVLGSITSRAQRVGRVFVNCTATEIVHR